MPLLHIQFFSFNFPDLQYTQQGHSRRSGGSGCGLISISQGKNKIPFYKKEAINKSIREFLDFYSFLYYDRVDRKGLWLHENNRPPTHIKINILCYNDVFYYAKLSNKQNAKVICRFDRLRRVHSKRQKAIWALQKVIRHPHICLHSAQD